MGQSGGDAVARLGARRRYGLRPAPHFAARGRVRARWCKLSNALEQSYTGGGLTCRKPPSRQYG
ncbi:hypothetical protein EV278_101397 [Caulobacter sp. BK020]|nr:hypothetical protein EV278_101397 [Caulobacter sp. BK020]